MKNKAIFVILGLSIVLAVLFLVYPTRQADDITNPAGKTLIQPQTGKFVRASSGAIGNQATLPLAALMLALALWSSARRAGVEE